MKLFISSLVLFCTAQLSLAQADEMDFVHDYILYNGYPYYVSMTLDGEILEFLKFAPEILGNEFDKERVPPMPLGPYVKPPEQELMVYNSPLNTTEVGDVLIVETEKVTEKKGTTTSIGAQDDKVTIQPKETSPEEPKMTTKIIEREPVKESEVIIKRAEAEAVEAATYELNFQGFSARLTPILINQLKDISKAHSNNPDQFVQIRSFVTAGDDTNKKLAINRMDACKDLLITYGVSADKVSTGIRPYRSASKGNVAIQLVDTLDSDF